MGRMTESMVSRKVLSWLMQQATHVADLFDTKRMSRAMTDVAEAFDRGL